MCWPLLTKLVVVAQWTSVLSLDLFLIIFFFFFCRYALICQQCLSHNGMALKEEFEYVGKI